MHTMAGGGEFGPAGLEPGSALRVLRDPHPGALQVAQLTAALPFQGRAGR